MGANCSVIVQDCPPPRITGEEKGKSTAPLHTALVTENAELDPLKEIALMVNGEPLVLVRISCWVALLFTSTLPKLIGPGFEYCATGAAGADANFMMNALVGYG